MTRQGRLVSASSFPYSESGRMKNVDPRDAVSRKLAALADALAQGASFPITRLTVLKRLCATWESAVPFACYLAEQSRDRLRMAPPSLPGEFGARMDATIACIHAFLAMRTRDAELALRAARRELASAQNETRDTRWATIRTIHSRDALVVEHAANCILEPHDSAAWAYRLGRTYAERYDPRHGGGLVPESAPLVRDIAGFWRHAPAAPALPAT